MYLTLLTLAALNFGGDQPIEPIGADVVETIIGSGDADLRAVCDNYPVAFDLLSDAVGDYSLATDLMDAWAIDTFEGGWSYDHSAHFTADARMVFLTWLHAC